MFWTEGRKKAENFSRLFRLSGIPSQEKARIASFAEVDYLQGEVSDE
ncbi:hypothetical protein KKC87_00980 [Patescibacteria group bacterium]|nr:hypothetical protein [Patescibacteria group bacterium]